MSFAGAVAQVTPFLLRQPPVGICRPGASFIRLTMGSTRTTYWTVCAGTLPCDRPVAFNSADDLPNHVNALALFARRILLLGRQPLPVRRRYHSFLFVSHVHWRTLMPQEPNSESTAKPLHPATTQRVRAVRLGLSLDGWAVVVALVLAIIVRLGVKIPW